MSAQIVKAGKTGRKRYMSHIRGQYAASTADGIISLLRSAFDRLLPVGVVNPFKARITRRGKHGGAQRQSTSGR